jgi:hypothetical protein
MKPEACEYQFFGPKSRKTHLCPSLTFLKKVSEVITQIPLKRIVSRKGEGDRNIGVRERKQSASFRGSVEKMDGRCRQKNRGKEKGRK